MLSAGLRGLRNSSVRSLLGRTSALRTYATVTNNGNPNYYDKLLIANRGEIACRVIKTARKLGIKTVAVYSTADTESQFVKMADEAVCIGPPLTNESYLVAENIIEACKLTGAQAIHPGYGFLSENRDFVEAVTAAGIDFIGPGTHAMEMMGDKLESKRVAKEAGVHTVPGFVGKIESHEHAEKIANEIGYPVMIKASHGGGGKGMRVAWNNEELHEGYKLSKAEALASFKNDDLLIEKFIDNPRHIEIQIIADKHGNTIYLPERECSIQRRNQKVIEEAPSAFLTPEAREEMGKQAAALAAAVNYSSAGTVEFLVDSSMNWYFLEMNTRLQVEHPITEEITGIDLVEQMIRVEAGHELPFKQSDVKINGWAIESRVYAEDPLRNFLPSIGRLTRYIEPQGEGVRCDSGILEGSEISIYYDPLICKLVTWGKDREEAVDRMAQALDEYVIRGVTHNINFLRDVVDAPRFRKAELSTNYIPEEYPGGFDGHKLSEEEANRLALTASAIHAREVARKRDHDQAPDTPLNDDPEHALIVTVDGQKMRTYVETSPEDDSNFVLLEKDNGKGWEEVQRSIIMPSSQLHAPVFTADVESIMDYASVDSIDDADAKEDKYTVQLLGKKYNGYKLQIMGTGYDVTVESEAEHELAKNIPVRVPPDMSKFVQSPMPGRVISVDVKEGDVVPPGAVVAVVEAMKMQNVLRSEKGGVVKAIKQNAGVNVKVDEVLIEFE